MSTHTNSQAVNSHPTFPVGTRVKARGYRIRGEVIYSANDKVIVNWGDNVQSYDGWAISNNVKVLS